jgi:hypothetical protein
MLFVQRILAWLVLAVVLVCSGSANAQNRPEYLFVSDIHLNPMANPAIVDALSAAPVEEWDRLSRSTALPKYGADTNFALFRLTLAQMKRQVRNPQVIVIPGDLLGHNFRTWWNGTSTRKADEAAYTDFTEKTIAYIAQSFDRTFPDAQFIVTLGNNDSRCDDYASEPKSPFLAAFAKSWEPLVNRKGRAPGFAHDFFETDGNYTTKLPNGVAVIVVNDTSWSTSAKNDCVGNVDVRNDSLSWFDHAVATSPRDSRTWVLLHIPPGINVFSSFKDEIPALTTFWAPGISQRFRTALANNGSPIGLVIAAHIHNDSFRIVDKTPLMLVPSMSPQHYNNPSFFAVRVNNATGAIDDYDAYNLNIGQPGFFPSYKIEYEFDGANGVQGFNIASLQTIQAKTANINSEAGAAAASHYVSGASVAPIEPLWHAYWCANVNIDIDDYADCVSRP